MPEQITLYHDLLRISPFCHRVEIALLEAGASYTTHGFDIYNKPAWFADVNPLTGKIPVITYGGPPVSPEEPSPLSSKITESLVILEFLADLFPDAGLLPPASDPVARAAVRFFIDAVRQMETSLFDLVKRVPDSPEKLIEAVENIQKLLPDPETAGGEYAFGKTFTNADCALAPLLGSMEVSFKNRLGRVEPEVLAEIAETLDGAKFDRLKRYQKAVLARESVKRVMDLEHMERVYRARFGRE